MSQYEYAAVPAPRQVPKVKGVKGAETRFAHAMTELLNTWAAEGWEFVRAEALGFEAKGGLFGKGSSGQTTLLVFRREMELAAPDMSAFMETAPTPEEMVREMRGVPSPRPALPEVEPEVPARPAFAPPLPKGPALTANREAGAAPLRPVPGPASDPGRPRRG